MIKPQTLKGFRDFLPAEARKRQYVVDTVKQVFESYGFEPLETPALEYEEILAGKYGEEGDKLMYKFEDLGGRKVALRYDQTVPLARVVAEYQNQLPMPFKRYQIQPVWRAENTQKGRFREFLQCDADIVGIDTSLSNAEVIAVAAVALEKLNFTNFKILINDRGNFKDIPKAVLIALDKYKKIGKKKVVEEILNTGFIETGEKEDAEYWLENWILTDSGPRLKEVITNLELLGIKKSYIEYSPAMVRGLDYYTSTIFEIEIENYEGGSVCGGGRYANLIGLFANKPIPAVGFAFGFDRLIEAMEELNLFPDNLITTKVLVTIFSSELKDKSIEVTSRLRSKGINVELYLNENVKMEKQLKYADQKGIPYVVILGPEEVQNNTVTIKNLKTREQKTVSRDALLKELTQT